MMDEDWATIRALLRAGCSLPADLEKKYQAHLRERSERMFGHIRCDPPTSEGDS